MAKAKKKKKESSVLKLSFGSVRDVDGEFKVKIQVITPWTNAVIIRDGDFKEITRVSILPTNGMFVREVSFPHKFAGKEVAVRVQTDSDKGKAVEEILSLKMPTDFRKKLSKDSISPVNFLRGVKEALTWQKVKKILSHLTFVLILTIAISLILGAANGKASVVIGFFLGLYIARKIGWFSFPVFAGFLAWCWFNPEDLSGGIMSALWVAVIMGEFFYILEELFHRKYEEPDGDIKLIKGFNFYPKVPIGICIFMMLYSVFGLFGEFVPDQKPQTRLEEGISLSEIDLSEWQGGDIDLSEWEGGEIDLSSGGESDSWFGQKFGWLDRVLGSLGKVAYWLLVMLCLAVIGIPGDIMDWWAKRKVGGPSGSGIEKGLLITELWLIIQNFFRGLFGRKKGV